MNTRHHHDICLRFLLYSFLPVFVALLGFNFQFFLFSLSELISAICVFRLFLILLCPSMSFPFLNAIYCFEVALVARSCLVPLVLSFLFLFFSTKYFLHSLACIWACRFLFCLGSLVNFIHEDHSSPSNLVSTSLRISKTSYGNGWNFNDLFFTHLFIFFYFRCDMDEQERGIKASIRQISHSLLVENVQI